MEVVIIYYLINVLIFCVLVIMLLIIFIVFDIVVDIIFCVEFNSIGDLFVIGDKGGCVVIF